MVHNPSVEDCRVTILRDGLLVHRFGEDLMVPLDELPQQIALRNAQYSSVPICITIEHKVRN